ncbi:Cu(I)/Ag(I) efflux system membrane protein CusA/SilA [Verrucomicrobium sp. GAS474]|uniref:efflux RND transporter permease subunit n=1 Tax=Verrucomicrobium sp. GAS474 TaxID=1882831 RepID=UPI00087D14C0|nr:CusA/CzcA family heavy metal efflux RND transporter [Verrucomicrobium sp. GAS474]SDU02305.1 Cu(I)/Ag(I) efflux system membrane protein CusA/SilA [Verrucomicrobium sp. GAS474]
MIGSIADWCGRNRVPVFFLCLLGAVWGVASLHETSLDALPDLSDTQVIVTAEWPGRSPALVEDQVTYPISSRFVSAPGVKAVRGQSMFGKAFVTVLFKEGTDLYWARSRVVEQLASVRGMLPEGIDPQIGPDASGVGWIYQYALVDRSGRHSLAELRTLQDWTLRYALASVPGVAEVAPVGGFVKTWQVTLDPAKLSAYGIGVAEVADAVRRSNGEAGGRTLEVSGAAYFVRGRGYLREAADLDKAVIRGKGASAVVVGQVGRVEVVPDLRNGIAEFDGEGETVGGIVVMRNGADAPATIDGVKRKLAALKPSLPEGVEVVAVYDRSVLIGKAVATLRDKIVEEALIVSLVCLLFLGHLRSALVAILMLPLAVLLAFIPFHAAGLSANIMSLGGIAIAIGAMVDAAIVMVEGAHREIARRGGAESVAERTEAVLYAARKLGRPLFFSLFVVAVSFIPVFALQDETGRLFRPLASTKTFAMFFAALLSVTLVPALMVLFIRGKIAPEGRNPLNRFLEGLYRPAVDLVLRFPRRTLALALLLGLATLFPLLRLGSEFMPPLNEGDILYMPTAPPGLSSAEAARQLGRQDAILKGFPEVESVFGKAGQAETATDPAPLSMFETTIRLKPESAWRPGMTREKLLAEMDGATRTPGMANLFWMPVQTRTQMLATGFRSALGLKVYGPDTESIDRAAREIERALSDLPGTRSVFAERLSGGRYLDIVPDRDALVRYGVTVAEVNAAVESAIGGAPVTTLVAGRERYPVAVRYDRPFRQDVEALGEVRVGDAGQGIPLSSVARIAFAAGPPEVRSEGGRLVGFVLVDLDASVADIGAYVADANRRIAERVPLPAAQGYAVEWAGTFESLRNAQHALAFVIPVTLLILGFLIWLNTGSMARTALVLLAVPFSLIGAFWLLWLLGFKMSVAVWIGLIALAGIDAETGVVMLLYLDEAFDERRAAGTLRTRADTLEAIREGAVRRLRPKAMTVCAILFGLLPILWTEGTGSEAMKRIAAPMVGGIVTSALLELLLYPVLYLLWRGRR